MRIFESYYFEIFKHFLAAGAGLAVAAVGGYVGIQAVKHGPTAMAAVKMATAKKSGNDKQTLDVTADD